MFKDLYYTYHDGCVHDITLTQLAYCKIIGAYNRTKYKLNDCWQYSVLNKERPKLTLMQEMAEIIAKCAAKQLAKDLSFYSGDQWDSKGDTIVITKPDRFNK